MGLELGLEGSKVGNAVVLVVDLFRQRILLVYQLAAFRLLNRLLLLEFGRGTDDIILNIAQLVLKGPFCRVD